MLYAFALTKTLGSVLYKLPVPDACYLVYGNNIQHYIDMLIHDKPTYILGMGSYSGKDQDKIRIETVTTNKFRNEVIEPGAPERITIDPFLQPLNENYKYASAMGNSWCNFISWRIMRLIQQGDIKARYTFVHVPESMRFHKKVRLLNELLEKG